MLPSLNGGGAERAAVQILNGARPNQLGSLDVSVRARRTRILREVDPSIAITSAGHRRRGAAAGARCGVHRPRAPDLVMAFLSYFQRAERGARAATRARESGVQPADADVRIPDRRRLPLAAELAPAAFAAVTRVGYAAADLIVATSHGVARRPDHQLRRRSRPHPRLCTIRSISIGVRAAIAEPIDAAICRRVMRR